MTFRPLTPRMRQLPPKKSAVLSVLDVGASKVVSLIARLTPTSRSEALPDRTHRCRVLGIGHQRSRGVKAGAIIDLDAAESAIRLAIDAAERMSGVEVDSVVVNMSGGRLSSQLFDAKIALRGKAVGQSEIHRVLEAASAAGSYAGRAVLHAAPTGFWLDGAAGVRDPKGMIGDELGAEMHVATCDAAAARNLMLAIERCHLSVAAMVATPYAAGLSTLVDDEVEMGAALVDFGAGTTSIGVFAGGRIVHVDAIAVGGALVLAAAFGFGGLRLTDAGLTVNPRLPAHWTALRFNIWLRGERLRFEVTQTGIRITVGKDASLDMPVTVCGHSVALRSGKVIFCILYDFSLGCLVILVCFCGRCVSRSGDSKRFGHLSFAIRDIREVFCME